MLNKFPKSSSQIIAGAVQSLVFFILFYLYLWLKVDLRLIYHGGGVITNFPVFLRGWTFFQQFTAYPGGPVEYLSALLSQFFYYSWAGAFVVTLLAWLICVCTGYFLKAINASHFRYVRFIPLILLLITYTQYTYHFVTTTALLVSLFFVCLYLRITPTSRLISLIIFLVLSVVLYYIAGGAYLLFAVLCSIYELLFRRYWQIGLLYLLSAAVIPYVEGAFIFGTNITDAFSKLLPFSWEITPREPRKRMITIVYILYLLLPLTALGLALWQILVRRITHLPDQSDASEANFNEARKGTKEEPPGKSFRPAVEIFLWLIESLVLLVIAGAVVFFSHDNRRKTLFAVDYYSCHRMWPQLLRAARRHPNSYFVVHAANRALYHTGRLGYDMLSYPQQPDTLLLAEADKKGAIAFLKRFDTYIDLGHMNIPENDLTESIERLGERPIILKRLAIINMVKGNIATAKVYLEALSKTLFYSDWANKYLDQIESDPNLSTDQQVQHLRSMMMEKDYVASLKQEEVFSALLEKNRQNRMAFEYLMAFYLLTKQLDKFVQNLDRLDDFDYPKIPRLYEEAILIWQGVTGKKVDLKGRRISPEVYLENRDFTNICHSFTDSDHIVIVPAALSGFEDSYFFYYNFRPPFLTR